MSPSFVRTCSQLFSTSLENPSSRFTLIVVFITGESCFDSLATHGRIIRSHLALISSAEWRFSWVIRSHLSTHMGWADFNIRIWSSPLAPLFLFICWACWVGRLFFISHLGGFSLPVTQGGQRSGGRSLALQPGVLYI